MGERAVDAVAEVGVAVGVLGGDRERVVGAGCLAGCAGERELGRGGRVDADGERGAIATLFPYTTLFRSFDLVQLHRAAGGVDAVGEGDRGGGAEVDGAGGLV